MWAVRLDRPLIVGTGYFSKGDGQMRCLTRLLAPVAVTLILGGRQANALSFGIG
jgi:hypothetical protein